jgi:hypothetical protein
VKCFSLKCIFQTVDWVSRLDGQLYPVLTSNTKSSKALARELEEKLQIVLPEVKRAQAEIELRIKTTETLAQKGQCIPWLPFGFLLQ